MREHYLEEPNPVPSTAGEFRHRGVADENIVLCTPLTLRTQHDQGIWDKRLHLDKRTEFKLNQACHSFSDSFQVILCHNCHLWDSFNWLEITWKQFAAFTMIRMKQRLWFRKSAAVRQHWVKQTFSEQHNWDSTSSLKVPVTGLWSLMP